VKSFCQYEPGKSVLESLEFSASREDIERRISMVEEFRQIMVSGINFPADHFIDLTNSLHRARVEGSWIEEEEVAGIRKVLDSTRNILGFFKNDVQNRFPALRNLAKDLKHFPLISERIDHILSKNNRLKDKASTELYRIRQALASMESDISKKLNRVLKKAQSEGWVDEETSLAIRNGRPVIPILALHKRKIQGYIHDESSSGKTVYIEPSDVVEANNELRELANEERREVVKILIEFTSFLRPYIPDLQKAQSFFAYLDSVRARAKFALDINAIKPIISEKPEIYWKDAIHPILLITFRAAGKREGVVPLSLQLDEINRILIISGPNAGGKSVCLQTAGLLQYMFQCGFLVPVAEGSVFGIFESIFIDIGDEQSIENDLSTYSSHLSNMKIFIKHSGKRSLILIDEFGAGTEPMMGGAIAESVLDSLNKNECFGVITTHYTNLKHFGASQAGLINGAMLYDHHNMIPLFKLDIGQPGSSFAFEIARKIGLPEEVLQRAMDTIGQDHIDFDKHLRDILRDKKYYEHKRQKIKDTEKRVSALEEKYRSELQETDKLRKKIIQETKHRAEEILSGVNRQIEGTIRAIKEAEAEKNKTKEARRKLDEMRKSLENLGEKEDDPIGGRMNSLKSHSDKPSKQNRNQGSDEEEKLADENFSKGNYVVMKGSENAGEVLGIDGKKLSVLFGSMKTIVDKAAIEKISSSKYRELTRRTNPQQAGGYNTSERRVNFRPVIDVRGKRGETALQEVIRFIDEAVMMQAGELRILHGKGNGILREMIRQYLKTVNVVSWFGDEKVEMGGAGITVVKIEHG
jgi:DNA mismatch repair protein MutS2